MSISRALEDLSNKIRSGRCRRLITLAASMLLLGSGLTGCDTRGALLANPTEDILPVTVIEATPQPLTMLIDTVGQAEGAAEVEVHARVSGILLAQYFHEGRTVEAGTTLFQIDPAPYQATYDLAEAELNRAKRELARVTPLIERGAISRTAYDDARTAQIAADARARQAKLNLDYATVTAPISGVTGRAVQSVGALVGPTDNSLLTRISRTDPIWVRFSLSEDEHRELRASASDVTVQLLQPDGSTYSQSGNLNFAASTVDPKLGTVQMRAEFPNPALAILPGQFVRVHVQFRTRNVVLVPQAAVLLGDQGHFVWTLDMDGKAVSRHVEVGDWRGEDWVILGGLAAGDKVVIDNIIKIRAGTQLQPHAAATRSEGDPIPSKSESRSE